MVERAERVVWNLATWGKRPVTAQVMGFIA
jgi:hypothetical protein